MNIEQIRTLESPFPGRTFISIYVPRAPVHLIAQQLKSELIRTEKSTNWKVKGVVIMMLKKLIVYIEGNIKDVPESGFVIFSVPKSVNEAIIHQVIPDKEKIDLFYYVLDERFYIKEEHFDFS